MSTEEVFLSIIIPCYNEEANLKRGVLSEVHKYLAKIKKFRFSDYCKTDESATNKDFVGQRVHYSPKLARNT